ncbi:MAG TPA: adenylate kinase family protein [Methanomassiliicoccales archaeon]|jgi:adenylate kinase
MTFVKLALTGTPGTGKSTVAKILASRGLKIIELGDLAKEKKLLERFDRKGGTYEVDVKKLDLAAGEIGATGTTILVGHLSHLIASDLIIILRCRPSVLAERLRSRGYPERKVAENAEAEALDVILVESVETGREVYEIDTTIISPEETADAIMKILAGEKEKYAIGNIDWSEEALDWS